MPVRITRSRTRWSALLAAAAAWTGLLLATPLRAESADSAAEPGVWQSHKAELAYMGFTTQYSCDGLQSKLELLLRRLGARSDAKVITFDCDRGYGVPSRFVRATLEFSTLQPADLATGQGSSSPTSATGNAAPAAQVNGSWRAVELSPYHPFDLADGDCELIEQFSDKILPLFATRALTRRTQCVPHQDLGGPFDLQLQVFAPLPDARPK